MARFPRPIKRAAGREARRGTESLERSCISKHSGGMTELTDFAVEEHPDLGLLLLRPTAEALHPAAIELRGRLDLPPDWQIGDLWLRSGARRVGGLQAAPLPPEPLGPGAQRVLLRGALGLIGLPPAADAELWLELRRPDGGHAGRLLARLAWRRPPLAPAPGGPRPLLVWVVGRSGSTVLLQWLAAHPELVTLPDYPYEGRLAQYYLNRLAVGAQPNDPWTGGQLSAVEEDWHGTPRQPQFGALGSNAQTPRPGFMRYLAGPAVQELAALTTGQIATAYRALARDLGKDPTCCFVEKFQPTFVATLASELYPDARHLFLVRDPRDTFASWQRFFPAEMPEEQLLEEFAAKQLAPHLAAWRSHGERAALLRYEDFVGDPAGALAPALARLGLMATPAVLAAMAAWAAERPLPAGHATADSPAESVGRWRRESPDWQAAATARCAAYLAAFGYPA
jgi:hypothetical protein